MERVEFCRGRLAQTDRRNKQHRLALGPWRRRRVEMGRMRGERGRVRNWNPVAGSAGLVVFPFFARSKAQDPKNAGEGKKVQGHAAQLWSSGSCEPWLSGLGTPNLPDWRNGAFPMT